MKASKCTEAQIAFARRQPARTQRTLRPGAGSATGGLARSHDSSFTGQRGANEQAAGTPSSAGGAPGMA